MARILIVEDERPISNLLKMSLTGEGHRCECVYDGREAADILEDRVYDLVLLDVMLPEIDGFELLEYIRPMRIPVIFLTARCAVSDRVRALKAGADDYITKPFEIAEMLARVESVLRRCRGAEGEERFEGIRADTRARTVLRNGEKVSLTAKEFDLLIYLLRNRNRALYRSQIYAQVWGGDELGDSRTVDLHVQRLRKKLGLEDRLLPVYKIGYRLEEKT